MYEALIPDLKKLCLKAGSFIRDNFKKISQEEIISKEKNSLVTFVDRNAEKMLIDELRNLVPGATFLTEEDSVENSESDLEWIVDPLDGTTNFLVGIPHFSISIALKVKNDIRIGVVYNVMTEEFYHAIMGKGAFINGRQIASDQLSNLDEALIATGFPYDKSKIDSHLLSILEYFVTQSRGVRRLGSASLDLCLLAQGTFHIYYERFLNAWDIAAGALIVKEAGGIICDFKGGQNFLGEGEIIACCPGLETFTEKIMTR